MSTVPYIRMTRVILSERNNVWYMQLVLLQNPLLLIIYVAESVSVCNFIHVGHTLFMNAFAILQLPRWDSVGVHLSDYSSDVCSWRGLYLGLRDLKYCEWTWANYIKKTPEEMWRPIGVWWHERKMWNATDGSIANPLSFPKQQYHSSCHITKAAPSHLQQYIALT